MKNNPAPALICNTLLKLLDELQYNDITMSDIAAAAFVGRRTCYRYFSTKDDIVRAITDDLMDKLAKGINNVIGNEAYQLGFYDVALCYFQLMEDNIDLLRKLKKAKLLHFIADNFEQMILAVAMKTKYRGMSVSDELMNAVLHSEKYYEFIFKVAGFWRVTVQWIDEPDRRSAETMAQIVCKF